MERDTADPIGDRGSVVAFELTRLATGAVVAGAGDGYRPDFGRRVRELIRCLVDPGDRGISYELRIVTEGRENSPTPARTRIFMMASSSTLSDPAGDLQSLLISMFPEHTWERMPADRMGELAPFTPRHAMAVTRRVMWENLATTGVTVGPRRRVGLIPQPAADVFAGDRVLHLAPFTDSSSIDHLLRILSMSRQPLVVGCRLTPTLIGEEEAEFLREMVSLCESHVQGLAPRDDTPASLSLLRQASESQAYQQRLLYALADDAAEAFVYVASTEAIGHEIVDGVGVALTGPAAGDGFDAYLSGGYDVAQIADPGTVLESRFDTEAVRDAMWPDVPERARRLPMLFDSTEAARCLMLPPAAIQGTWGIERRSWRTVPIGPLPADGTLVGTKGDVEVRLPVEDRMRHTYVVGQTGTGKTTLLQTMALSDIERGEGVCVIDPHGDMFEWLLGRIPEDRIEDVVLVDPIDREFPVGLNVLEWSGEDSRYLLAQEFLEILRRLGRDEWGAAYASMTGPVFNQNLRNNLLLVMSGPEGAGTLPDLFLVFERPDYWKRFTPPSVSDPILDAWIDNGIGKAKYDRVTDDGLALGQYFSSKLAGLVFSPTLRNILGQANSTIRLGDAMDEGKIVLVNLAKGRLAESGRQFGMFFLAQLLAAAMRRIDQPDDQRRPFHVYVDEFQSMATETFITMLSEARKFGLGLVLANQFVGQVDNEKISEAIIGNVGTMISFRLGVNDAAKIAGEMPPDIQASDLVGLPNWTAYVSTTVHGKALDPFDIETVVSATEYSSDVAVRVRAESRQRWARPRAEVEREIEDRLAWEPDKRSG